MWRLKFRWFDREVRFQPALYGWPWVPVTVSWVVPTALALLALSAAFPTSKPQVSMSRVNLGCHMLLDRRRPEGGWNAGNSVVFGVPLGAHIDTTALALLALRRSIPGADTSADLRWLESRLVGCRSAYSLAFGICALAAHQRDTRAYAEDLSGLVRHGFLDPVVAALCLLALRARPGGSPFGDAVDA